MNEAQIIKNNFHLLKNKAQVLRDNYKTKDKDNHNDKTISINKIKDKDMLINVYSSKGKYVIEKDIYLVREKHVIVYWNNNNTSEIEEKLIFYNGK